MEERNLEMDDDGKIKLRKSSSVLPEEKAEEEGEIVIDVPDFEQFKSEDNRVGLSEEELAAKAAARERQSLDKKEQAEALFFEAEKLFAEGDADGAGEKYLDSAALYGADWRPWFGVVRVQTKDFTNFTEIYDCEKAYEKAFRRMPEAERASLAEKYVPSMERTVREAKEKAEKLSAQDENQRQEERGEIVRTFRTRRLRLILSASLFALFLIAACVLFSFMYRTPGWGIPAAAAVCTGLAVIGLCFTAYFLKKFLLANRARRENALPLTTEAGVEAAHLKEYAELVQSVVDDFKR